MATHSSLLAGEISWTEEPGELQLMGSLTVGEDLLNELIFHSIHAPHLQMDI